MQTTAHTICWTLFLVATHPDVESCVLAELADLGLLATAEQPTPQDLKWEHLAQVRELVATRSTILLRQHGKSHTIMACIEQPPQSRL